MEKKIDEMTDGSLLASARKSPQQLGVGRRMIKRPARLEISDDEVPMELEQAEKVHILCLMKASKSRTKINFFSGTII